MEPQREVRPGIAGNPELRYPRIFAASLAVSATLLVLALGVVATHLDRGFDFSDEGVYYLNFQFPEEFPAGFTQYHLFGAWLYRLCGGNIVALRALPWLGLFLVTLFFGLSWWRLARPLLWPEPPAPRVGISVLTLLGASVFVSFSWPPPGVSYNSLADFGMLFAAGALFWAVAPQTHGFWRVAGVGAFAAGLVFLLMVKGSAAVGVGLVGGLFLLLVPTLPWSWKLALVLFASLAAVGGGIGLWLAAPEQFLAVREFFLSHLQSVLGSFLSGKSVDPMLQRHWQEVWQLPWRMLLSFNLPMLLALALGLVGRWAPNWLRPPSRWFDLALVGVFLALLSSLLSKDGYLAGITHRHGSILAYAAILGLLIFLLPARGPLGGADVQPKPRASAGLLWSLALLLFFLPFVTAAGTTHRIYINALLHLGPFFALIALCGLLVARRTGSWLPWSLTLLLTSGVALSQFFHGGFFVPYRLPTSLVAMQESVEIGVPATRLRVDPGTALFTRELQGLLQRAGFQPGDDLLAFFDMPGVVFAMGGRSPGRPWYFPNYGEQGERENLAALRIAGRDRIRRAILLQSNHDPRVGEYLSTLDLRFPDDYEWIGETWQPYREWSVTVWRPRP